jgi:hypothetical protein
VYSSLTELEQDEIIAIVELLAERGPELDRPYADRIKRSTIHNMKELRPRGIAKHFRVLFVFDPRREAILLTGGDKSGQWDTWYVTAIRSPSNCMASISTSFAPKVSSTRTISERKQHGTPKIQ